LLVHVRFLTAGATVFAAGFAIAGCRSSAASPLPTTAAPVASSSAGAGAGTTPPTPPTLEVVGRSALCFTEGAPARHDERGEDGDGGVPRHSMRLDAGAVRAFVAGDRGARSAELAFSFRGPSAFDAPLANGELRRQIGLKLRAQDTCNVVYVMWHVEPKPGVAVSVKRNVGRSTHAACGDGGYLNLTSDPGVARAPVVVPGDAHVLRADLDGRALRVTADGVVVWRGELPSAALQFDGPAGFRTDNGTFDVELRVPNGRDASDSCSGR